MALHRFRSEEGAVAVITAIVLVVLVGSAALAIDLGQVRTQRRAVVTTTDATALGVAKYLSDEGGTGTNLNCDYDTAYDDVAHGLITAEDPDAWPPEALYVEVGGITYVDLTDATSRTAMGALPCPTFGRVVAELTINESLGFASIFGMSDTDIDAKTVVAYGALDSGALPLAFCATDDPIPTAIEQVDTYDVDYPSDGTSVALHFPIGASGSTGNGCGVTPGNLGWVDCDGDDGSGGSNDVADWIEDGCPVTFLVDDPSLLLPVAYEIESPPPGSDLWVTIPGPIPPGNGLALDHVNGNECGSGAQYDGWCDVITGSVKNTKSALLSLAGSDRAILLYDHADCGNDSGPVALRGYFESCRTTSSSAVEYRLTQYTTVHIDAVCYENPGPSAPDCAGSYTAHDGTVPAGPPGPDFTTFDVNNASGFVLWVSFKEFTSVAADVGDGGGGTGLSRGLTMCGTETVSCD